jgi:ACS family glucarate transporter-like MFS transporter
MPRIPVRALLVLGTFSLSVLLYVDRVCISAATGPMKEDLGLLDTEMGWAFSAFALGYALLQTPSGVWADRFGARRLLTAVVVFWSLFTGLTAAAWDMLSLVIVRFLFGAGEAGAFPGIARAAYSWIPMRERGLVQGINFSGSRIGAAFALPLVSLAIVGMGWQATFVVLMVVGFVWAVFWYGWFRDDPTAHATIGEDERNYILAERQTAEEPSKPAARLTLDDLALSPNAWLIFAQYFCSNFTFYFCLSWFFPFIQKKYSLTPFEAGVYASVPFLCGAMGNWLAGWLVDRLFRRGRWTASRRVPAAAGFALAAVGVVGCAYARTPLDSVAWFSLAIFGADMTLAPSWSVCIDIGRRNAGMVSGTMNMAGNLGSFVTSLAFPYLAKWTGSDMTYFYMAAALNVVAVFLWLSIDPKRPLEAGR